MDFVEWFQGGIKATAACGEKERGTVVKPQKIVETTPILKSKKRYIIEIVHLMLLSTALRYQLLAVHMKNEWKASRTT